LRRTAVPALHVAAAHEIRHPERRAQDPVGQWRAVWRDECGARLQKSAPLVAREDARHEALPIDLEETGTWNRRARLLQCEEPTDLSDQAQPMPACRLGLPTLSCHIGANDVP